MGYILGLMTFLFIAHIQFASKKASKNVKEINNLIAFSTKGMTTEERTKWLEDYRRQYER